MDEIKNFEDIETTEEVNEDIETTETEENGISVGILLAGAGLVAGVVGGIVYWLKNKNELSDRKAKRYAERLRKMGYAVVEPETAIDCEDEEDIETV